MTTAQRRQRIKTKEFGFDIIGGSHKYQRAYSTAPTGRHPEQRNQVSANVSHILHVAYSLIVFADRHGLGVSADAAVARHSTRTVVRRTCGRQLGGRTSLIACIVVVVTDSLR